MGTVPRTSSSAREMAADPVAVRGGGCRARLLSPRGRPAELRPNDVALAWTPFPNPVAPGGSLSAPTARLALWDLLGREVTVLEARHGQVILPADLAHGTYLAQPQGRKRRRAPLLGSARRIVVGPVR